jgi:hypothetical protein
MNTTPLGRATIQADDARHEFPCDTACITGNRHLAAYLEPLAKTAGLNDCLRLQESVGKRDGS